MIVYILDMRVTTGSYPMGRQKQTPLIATRLATADLLRFEQICRLEGKTRSDIARKALLEFLDRYEHGAEGQVKDRLAERLK